jgi:hypothetical protein
VPRNDTLSTRWPEQSLAILARSSLRLLRRFRLGLPGSVVELLHIGEMDLAADLGVRPDTTASQFLYARSIVVIASRAAGLVPRAAPSAQRSTTSPDRKPRPVSYKTRVPRARLHPPTPSRDRNSKGEEAAFGIYLCIGYRDTDFGPDRLAVVQAACAEYSAQGKTHVVPLFVDARPKPSASKA